MKTNYISYLLLILTYIYQSLSQICDSPCSQTQTCPDKFVGKCCHKENIARSRPTNQSSFYTEGRVNFTSNLAVDGNTNTDFTAASCTHTDPNGSPGASWTVYLGSTFNISQMRIYLRNSYGDRNNGLQVRVDQEECVRLNKTFTSYIPAEDTVQDIRCTRPLQGTTVTVQVDGHILTLCEVQVFVCSDGWYGEDCDRQCQCKDSEVCDKITGWCRTGCRAGKQGDGCQCECNDGSHGVNCMSPCGKCLDNLPCNKASGECPSGCQPNFIPPYCSACSDFFFLNGSTCNKCGRCQKNLACSSVDGRCHGVCESGYQPPYCKLACSDGWYGEACDRQCQCKDQEICDKKTGLCSSDNSSVEKETGCQGENTAVIAGVGVACLIFGIVSTLISLALIRKLRNKRHGGPHSETVQESNLYNTLSLGAINENTYTGLRNPTGKERKEDSENAEKHQDYYNIELNTASINE